MVALQLAKNSLNPCPGFCVGKVEGPLLLLLVLGTVSASTAYRDSFFPQADLHETPLHNKCWLNVNEILLSVDMRLKQIK